MSSTTITEPSRQTPVYGEFDVVVVGGGPAGIMAAAATARAGCSALLIERYGFLGGAGTAGGLSTFCGLHARTHGEDVRVIRGLADELLDRLVMLDGLNAPHLTIADGIAAQAFDISAYKIAADELVTGSGAKILFHAMAVSAVMRSETEIDAVLIESKSGRHAVRGRFFIDASGDGDLAAWAGVPYEKSPPVNGMMYPSLMFRINGVDVAKAGPTPWRTVANLYVTGRCASMTHGAQSAARVTGPCFAMGEAAGTAAGMALDASLSGDQIDVTDLQRRLENQGAYLGCTTPEPLL